MTTVHESITINATREQIRPFFFDPDSIVSRSPNIYRYQPDDNWPAVGAQHEMGFKTFLMNVNAIGTCLAYDPDTMRLEFELASEDNTSHGHWLYTFDEQDGQTTISVTIDYTLPNNWLGQVVDRLLVERKNRQQVIDNLTALKQQVEAAVAVPT